MGDLQYETGWSYDQDNRTWRPPPNPPGLNFVRAGDVLSGTFSPGDFKFNGGVYSLGSTAAFWTEERDSVGSFWVSYATGQKYRINGAGTDLFVIYRSAVNARIRALSQMVVGADEDAMGVDYGMMVVGQTANNLNHLCMKNQPGGLGGTNLGWYLKTDKANKTFEIIGYDGTTLRTFHRFDYANNRQYMQDVPVYLRSFGDLNHGLWYTASTTGQAIDGPILMGNAGCAVGAGNNWGLRTNGADCWTRGWLYTDNTTTNSRLGGGSAVGSSQSAFGQHKGFAQNQMHFSTSGNDSHIDWASNYQFWVDVTNVKNFVIQHPIKEDNYLIHACIEGPEAAVFYRGQSQLEGGWVEVKLPDYFEDLCAVEGRSVQLTCIADDPQDEWCPALHATYPKNGKFYVGLGSGFVINDQRFWWEVKAIRKDVPAVNVEPTKDSVTVMGDGPYTYYKENA